MLVVNEVHIKPLNTDYMTASRSKQLLTVETVLIRCQTCIQNKKELVLQSVPVPKRKNIAVTSLQSAAQCQL